MSGSIIDHAKVKILEEMYRSVDRMNHHCIDGQAEGVQSEQHLQINLRSNFKELQERQGVRTER